MRLVTEYIAELGLLGRVVGGRSLLEGVVGRGLLTRMSSGGEESEVPDGATARKMIKEFETVTNTDEILAQYQLQVTRDVKNSKCRSKWGPVV